MLLAKTQKRVSIQKVWQTKPPNGQTDSHTHFGIGSELNWNFCISFFLFIGILSFYFKFCFFVFVLELKKMLVWHWNWQQAHIKTFSSWFLWFFVFCCFFFSLICCCLFRLLAKKKCGLNDAQNIELSTNVDDDYDYTALWPMSHSALLWQEANELWLKNTNYYYLLLAENILMVLIIIFFFKLFGFLSFQFLLFCFV